MSIDLLREMRRRALESQVDSEIRCKHINALGGSDTPDTDREEAILRKTYEVPAKMNGISFREALKGLIKEERAADYSGNNARYNAVQRIKPDVKPYAEEENTAGM